jgi:hypothetical protein
VSSFDPVRPVSDSVADVAPSIAAHPLPWLSCHWYATVTPVEAEAATVNDVDPVDPWLIVMLASAGCCVTEIDATTPT